MKLRERTATGASRATRRAPTTPAAIRLLATFALAGLAACASDPRSDGDTADLDVDLVDSFDDADGSDVGGDDLQTGSDDGEASGDTADGEAPGDTADSALIGDDALDDAGLTEAPLCDALMLEDCALPWPSNVFLASDDTRETGYTLRFESASLPRNRDGQSIDPSPYERLDGYGVGSSVLVVFPDIDRSRMPDEREIERSLDDDAEILLFVERGGELERVPYWVEVDAKARGEELQTLLVRPAVILEEASRYVVAFRELRRTDGTPMPRSAAFSAFLNGTTDSDAALASRQGSFDRVFDDLEAAGVARESLTLAWDFVTASSDALHGRMLHMRDDALERAGDLGPELRVDSVFEYAESDDGSGLPIDPEMWLRIEGTFVAPDYMEDSFDGVLSGKVFRLDDEGMPLAEGSVTRSWWALVPHSARGGAPHDVVVYGHGLLGSGAQMYGNHNRTIANEHRLIFVSASLTGMSTDDVTTASLTASSVNRFPWLADHLHQGLLEWVLLARAARQRLADVSELTDRGIDVTSNVYYSGISQGGIFGASFVALSPDVDRGHLGVPGVNYTLLLERSIDFVPYFVLADLAYAERHQKMILISLVGLLWEGTDSVSYMRHVSEDPFPGSGPNRVLLAPAKGDPEVAVVTNEIVARSGLGVAVMENYGRELALIDETPYPHAGSGVVLYDFGHPWPEPGIVPPGDGGELGNAHSFPKQQAHHNQQMVTFFRTGEIVDVCGGDGCAPD